MACKAGCRLGSGQEEVKDAVATWADPEGKEGPPMAGRRGSGEGQVPHGPTKHLINADFLGVATCWTAPPGARHTAGWLAGRGKCQGGRKVGRGGVDNWYFRVRQYGITLLFFYVCFRKKY